MGCNASTVLSEVEELQHMAPANMVNSIHSTEDALAFMRMQLSTCETILFETQRLRKQLFTLVDSTEVSPHFLGNLYDDIDDIERSLLNQQSSQFRNRNINEQEYYRRRSAVYDCIGQLLELRVFFLRAINQTQEVLQLSYMNRNQDIALEFQWKAQTLQEYFQQKNNEQVQAVIPKTQQTLESSSSSAINISTMNTMPSIVLSKQNSLAISQVTTPKNANLSVF